MAIDLKQIQGTIDYDFKNEDLLQQAFVRRSYSEENGGQNNEVLEFIGDKVLDLVVIRLMMERFGEITENKEYSEFKLKNPKYFNTKLDEGDFTDIKKDLVEKKALSSCMERLGFHTQLIMGKGDRKGNIQEQDSVKEDLFEAILGAVALDCDYNMDILTRVVETMIDFDAYFESEEIENYVGLVQEWSQKNGHGLPNYEYDDYYDEYVCYLTIFDVVNARGYGSSQAKARMDAAQNAYNWLDENGYIDSPIEEAIGEANPNESLRQINELVQKGLIEKPKFDTYKDYDDDGNPIWTCEGWLEDWDYFYKNKASVKKEAQRMTAYEILLDLLGQKED